MMHETQREQMLELLTRQREDYLREGAVSAATRHDRLERAVALLIEHADPLVEAMREDFGHRSPTQSLFTDVAGSIGPLRHAQNHLGRWMKAQ
jgi:coniferyl-aldehyde dehydrogenase